MNGVVSRARLGIRVYDNEGRELPSGEVGEIYTWLHGMPDFTYHGLPERRREIERDGLVSLGDVGYIDEDGYLVLCDRKRDMVISGGVNWERHETSLMQRCFSLPTKPISSPALHWCGSAD
jgi:long-chain acyl-CoA synthetase